MHLYACKTWVVRVCFPACSPPDHGYLDLSLTRPLIKRIGHGQVHWDLSMHHYRRVVVFRLFTLAAGQEAQVAVDLVLGPEGLEIFPGFLEHGVFGALLFHHLFPSLFEGVKHLV